MMASMHSVCENEAKPLDADVLNHRSKMNPRFLQFLTLSLLYQESHQTKKAVTSGGEDDNEGKCLSPLPAQDDILEPKDEQDKAGCRDDCKDAHSMCEKWAAGGECSNNSSFMTTECRKSCKTCPLLPGFYRKGEWKHYEDIIELYIADDSPPKLECEDQRKECSKWQRDGDCEQYPEFMESKCPKSCNTCKGLDYYRKGGDLGVLQSIIVDDDMKPQDIQWMIGKARNYIEYIDDPDVIHSCKNKHRFCAYWAAGGECALNKSYMHSSCAPVCNACGITSYEERCPIDPNAKSAWEPGDLDQMFHRLTSEPFKTQYDVTILSSPPDGPWVITMENILSQEEAHRLIELGHDAGYERSTEVGNVHDDGSVDKDVTKARTSTNAWCIEETCVKDDVTIRVLERMSNLTNIPETNSEYIQLLRYEPSQYYRPHHDYVHHHIERLHGVRILTVYLYLNDVQAGGGTKFDVLDLTVQPKAGRALIWPSTLNESPNEIDERTGHQALPVETGIKYGANMWFHQFDFRTPDANGCIE